MVIQAEHVRAGDIVEYGGELHVVTEVRRPGGAAWSFACDGTGWAIALGRQALEVRRSEVADLQLVA
jgi:hypothetical protein